MVSIDDVPFDAPDLSFVLRKEDGCLTENIYPIPPHPSMPNTIPLEMINAGDDDTGNRRDSASKEEDTGGKEQDESEKEDSRPNRGVEGRKGYNRDTGQDKEHKLNEIDEEEQYEDSEIVEMEEEYEGVGGDAESTVPTKDSSQFRTYEYIINAVRDVLYCIFGP
ncbi:unnamed protein product [Hermetia illucens]|uniref:Uncharacterized protein n=1 Tax=Hermetia illucens TaxID=343691 RepID=A0A7R8UHB8_HERIL|nr:unnamed protein product [Hermetia illucens]